MCGLYESGSLGAEITTLDGLLSVVAICMVRGLIDTACTGGVTVRVSDVVAETCSIAPATVIIEAVRRKRLGRIFAMFIVVT